MTHFLAKGPGIAPGQRFYFAEGACLLQYADQISGGNVTGVTLKTMLEKNHLSLNNVQRINVHYNLTQALLSKKVDAVTGMMRTFEVIQMQLAGQPARIFLPEKNE